MGGITEAGRSKGNRTGTWRYKFPFVNADLCNCCGNCELFCPDSCVSLTDEAAVINDYYCKGCGICAVECPKDAITMQPEGEKLDE